MDANSQESFILRMVTFQKKSDAVCLCLVFDSNKLPDYKKGSGYHHPQKSMEPPRGIDSYPAIFLYPPVRITDTAKDRFSTESGRKKQVMLQSRSKINIKSKEFHTK